MTSNQFRINISPPNLMNICVDSKSNGEICGRVYHCYAENAIPFTSVVELLNIADKLFDDIQYPQASTKTRTFEEKQEIRTSAALEKKVSQQELIQHRGEKGTFILHVKFRQKSTWQGELSWMEKEERFEFVDSFEAIKIIDQVVV